MGASEPVLLPPSEIRFRRSIRLRAAVREVWHARELVRSLVERELRADHTQAILGFAWAVITPVTLMVVFSLFFSRIAAIDTGGAPYVLFAYLGLLPWTFFSGSVSRAGLSLVQNAAILNKVYCPREVFPLSTVIVVGIETVIATVVLVALFAVTRFVPKSTIVFAPVLLLVLVAYTLGVTLIVSSVVVYFRDLRHALPLILQLGLFATPVAYGIEVVPHQYHRLYAVVNPLAPIIDGYRRTILLGQWPSWETLILGTASSVALLVVGYLIFKHLETGFADVA